jgi:hypothetical protein
VQGGDTGAEEELCKKGKNIKERKKKRQENRWKEDEVQGGDTGAEEELCKKVKNKKEKKEEKTGKQKERR